MTFDQASNEVPAQEITLEPKDYGWYFLISGSSDECTITLKFVKFQNVNSLSVPIFVTFLRFSSMTIWATMILRKYKRSRYLDS